MTFAHLEKYEEIAFVSNLGQKKNFCCRKIAKYICVKHRPALEIGD